MSDARVADMEVIWDTNQAGRNFESQLAEEHVDEDALVRRRSRKEWPDPRLSLVWDARISNHAPDSNRRPAKELVQALIEVLVDVETQGGTPEQMVKAAGKRLILPRDHLHTHNWVSEWQQADSGGIRFEEFLLNWGQQTGYWYPQLLVDDGVALSRRVWVWRVSEPDGAGGGMVRTFPAVPDSAWGEYEHMLSKVQGCIDAKTAKRQMENAPGRRWLFVVLDSNMAAAQLDDYFGPARLAPDAPERCPYHVLDTLTFDYFDEVWVTGRAFHERSDIVLRLFKSGDAPQHKVVESTRVGGCPSAP